MPEAVIVEAVRTPVGRLTHALAYWAKLAEALQMQTTMALGPAAQAKFRAGEAVAFGPVKEERMVDNGSLAGLFQKEIAVHNLQGGQMAGKLFKSPARRNAHHRPGRTAAVEGLADLPHGHIAAKLVLSGPKLGVEPIIAEELGK